MTPPHHFLFRNVSSLGQLTTCVELECLYLPSNSDENEDVRQVDLAVTGIPLACRESVTFWLLSLPFFIFRYVRSPLIVYFSGSPTRLINSSFEIWLLLANWPPVLNCNVCMTRLKTTKNSALVPCIFPKSTRCQQIFTVNSNVTCMWGFIHLFLYLLLSFSPEILTLLLLTSKEITNFKYKK